MQLKSEKEIMEMDKKSRSEYLNGLGKFVYNNGGSIPQEVFPNFNAEYSKGSNCPKCGGKSIDNDVIINTTNHTNDSWIEHCICKNCGKFHSFTDGV